MSIFDKLTFVSVTKPAGTGNRKSSEDVRRTKLAAAITQQAAVLQGEIDNKPVTVNNAKGEPIQNFKRWYWIDPASKKYVTQIKHGSKVLEFAKGSVVQGGTAQQLVKLYSEIAAAVAAGDFDAELAKAAIKKAATPKAAK